MSVNDRWLQYTAQFSDKWETGNPMHVWAERIYIYDTDPRWFWPRWKLLLWRYVVDPAKRVLSFVRRWFS